MGQLDMVTVKLIVGLVVLVIGAELLVRGASKLALAFGMTPLVVGLTVVAFGTSAPEFAVTFQGALAGASGVSSGNVIGSNIFNILFILGVSALVAPLVVHREIVRVQVPIVVAATLLTFALGFDGAFGRVDGVIFTVLAVGYVIYTVRQGRREALSDDTPPEVEEEQPSSSGWRTLLDVVFVAAGLGLLIFGADWLVSSSVSIAKEFGVSDFVIGVTIVAGGTSLPEVATSVTAAARGQRDIAVGNVVGSNAFNILVVLGVSALVAPSGIAVEPSAITLDLPVMLASAALLFPIVYTEHEISRWEAVGLLSAYIGYVSYLIISTT